MPLRQEKDKLFPNKQTFISYILQPQLHQDVAFATKTLKLDSGERIIIPAVMRTLIPSRIIEQYTSY